MVMDNEEFEALIKVAQNWQKEPTGEYPWHAKKQYVTKKSEMGLGLEPIEQPSMKDKKTQFINARDVELPDPGLISIGEVASYVAVLVPVILTGDKDAHGKWIIHDGRHRVAAWRAAGYEQIPVVFMNKPTQVPDVFLKGME